MSKRIVMSGLLFLVLILGAAAQDKPAASPAKKATIEELYLRGGEIVLIREMAFTNDYDLKMESLKLMEKNIKDGNYDNGDPSAHLVLDYLSEEGITRITRENGRIVNYFPDVRRESCRILGQLGGEESKNTLLNVLQKDDDMAVKAEAVYALGVIGMNDDSEVTKAITFALTNQKMGVPDDNFAMASMFTVEKLLDKNGKIDDPYLYRAIVQIAQNSSYIREVRSKANQLIAKLHSAN